MYAAPDTEAAKATITTLTTSSVATLTISSRASTTISSTPSPTSTTITTLGAVSNPGDGDARETGRTIVV
jgi:hypothetical protein